MRRKVPPPKFPRPSHLVLVQSKDNDSIGGFSLWLKVGAVVILVALLMLLGGVFIAGLLTFAAKGLLQ